MWVNYDIICTRVIVQLESEPETSLTYLQHMLTFSYLGAKVGEVRIKLSKLLSSIASATSRGELPDENIVCNHTFS